jgi:membrane-bound inhibitor of C-type lysozyme
MRSQFLPALLLRDHRIASRPLTAALLSAAAVVAGCGSWNPWAGPQERRVGPPSDATVYQCEGGKQLTVRYMDGGKAAMVMMPDRHFRLDQEEAGSGTRYSNGRTTLATQGQEAFLEEGGNRLYTNCTSAPRPGG